MIRIRRGTVIEARARHPGLVEATVEVEGARATALAYEGLTAPLEPGDTVILNTTAVALGLGTGGVHFVIAVEGKECGDRTPGHGMKVRYTPLQTAVDPVEGSHRDALDAVEDLDGLPVIAAGLHSALAPAAIGVRSVAPGATIVVVLTDGGALPAAFSDTIPALRGAGLIARTITAGQAFGGDLEAVALPGALAAARAIAGADVVVVAMGPGNMGTGSRWGFASLEVAAVVNTAAAMGARAIVAPRISGFDARPRHRGVSHHTITALSLMLARAEVALPPLGPDMDATVREQLATIAARHDLVHVPVDDESLRSAPVPLRSMGRGFEDDPDYFRAAAAAGVRAGMLLAR